MRYINILIILLFIFPFTCVHLNFGLTTLNKRSLYQITNTSFPSDVNWSYNLVDAAGADKITNGSNKITVAIVDTGIDSRIPEIQHSLWKNSGEIPNNGIDDDHNGYIDDFSGWNFVNDDNNLTDNVGHGTFIASLFTGVSKSTSGKTSETRLGLASNISLMIIKVLNSEQSTSQFSADSFVKAINYAVNNGAKIISMSLTWQNPPNNVVDALKEAYQKGVLLISVTGNEAQQVSDISDLSKLPEIMAIGAVNSTNQRASFSQYGQETELMAPGENVFGSLPINNSIISNLTINGNYFESLPLQYSALNKINSSIVYAGLGFPNDFSNISVNGKIALIDRGVSYFRDKVANATINGAIGVIIANNDNGLFSGTLITKSQIPAIAISLEDGNKIKDLLNNQENTPLLASMDVSVSNTSFLSGTSFAAPHVSATAALMLSVNQNLSNIWLRLILDRTATDLGPRGRDPETGFGLLNMSYAVQSAEDTQKPVINTNKFNNNTLKVELTDNNAIYRLDYGYLNENDKIENKTEFFSPFEKYFMFFIPFNQSVDSASFYILIEDISGNREFIKQGNIDFSIPEYTWSFQTNETGKSPSFLVLGSIFTFIILGLKISFRRRKNKET
ncbi:MAG: S8 family serine peptidase [Candidatus Thorarchaeota archaeon]